MKWATVTVTDSSGRRYSHDVEADSTFDAAHQYLVWAKEMHMRHDAPPFPSLATAFEVVVEGKVYIVHGSRLQKWIVERRQKLSGPKGYLFTQRPTFEK